MTRKLDYETLAYAAKLIDPSYVRNITAEEASEHAPMVGALSVLERLGIPAPTKEEARCFRRAVWKAREITTS